MATMQEEEEAVTSWEKYYPAEITQAKSVLFMKKLLVMAVSNITYLRNLLPEFAFEDKALLGLNLKIIKKRVHPKASRLIAWLTGCFDALEKQYLRQMMIGIYEKNGDPECVMESYNFRFSYQDGISMSMNKDDMEVMNTNTRTSTLTLLRTILVLTSTLRPLPPTARIVIKLHYYDEVTPPAYQPPGFSDCTNENFTYQVDPVNIEIGEVETPFNILKMRVKTDKLQFENGGMGLGEPTDVNNELENQLEPVNNLESENQDNNEPENQDHSEPLGVRCACNSNENTGLMILCLTCNYWQHAICFRILNEKMAPKRHVCHFCVMLKNPDRQPTDPSLVSLSSIATQAVCMWRRTIGLCLDSNRVHVKMLTVNLGIDQKVADGLITRLKNEGFIKKKLLKNGHVVDKKVIETVGKAKYFDLLDIPSPEEEKKLNDVENNLNPNATDDVASLSEKTKAMTVKDAKTSVNRKVGNRVSSTKGRKRGILTANGGQAFDLASSQDTTFYRQENVTPVKKWKTSRTSPSYT